MAVFVHYLAIKNESVQLTGSPSSSDRWVNLQNHFYKTVTTKEKKLKSITGTKIRSFNGKVVPEEHSHENFIFMGCYAVQIGSLVTDVWGQPKIPVFKGLTKTLGR